MKHITKIGLLFIFMLFVSIITYSTTYIDDTQIVVNNITHTGNTSLNLFYAEAWNKADHSTAVPFETIVLSTPDTYVQVTNLTNGSINGFTLSNGNFTALYGGVYLLNSYADAVAVLVGGEYGMKVFINNNGQNDCYNHKDMTTDIHTFMVSCIIRVNPNDIINVRFDDHANPTRNLQLYYTNINIVRIGN